MHQRSHGTGLPPWHLWGNTQTIGPVIATASDQQETFVQGQLCKVSYRRPETWHWLFSAKILGIDPNVPPGAATARITVAFDLIVGIGRAQQTLKDFDTFSWTWSGVTDLAPFDRVLWATSARTPALAYIGPAPFTPDPATIRSIDEIVAQDIQLSARVSFFQTGFDAGVPSATVEVSGFFAPKNHIRPEWFVERFPGGEM